MEIEYRQVTADYYNAYRHISKRLCATTKWRHLNTVAGVIFGLSLVTGVVSITKFYDKHPYLSKDDLNFGIWAIAIGTALVILSLRIFGSKVRPLIFESGGLFLSPQSFKIEETHLSHKMGESEHYYQWKYVKEIEQTPGYIFVFIDRGAALYIPRHGFESEEQYNEFTKELSVHAQKNR